MDDDNRKIVFPGDRITPGELFMAGYGTYEDEEGYVRAAILGIPIFNEEERTVSIKPLPETPNVIEKGDIVIGRVKDIRGTMAIVEIARKQGISRSISRDTDGILLLSNASERNSNDFSIILSVGDIISAKVIEESPRIVLDMKEGNLGVILSTCPRCGIPLVREDRDTLYCPSCEDTWKKKLADDYGMVWE